jgi:hypothetical protein
MLQKLRKFSLLNPPNFSWEVVVCAGVIWLVVVACAIWSIRSQPRSTSSKIVWSMVVLVFPLIGMLAYLPFSFNRDSLPFFALWRKPLT